MRAAAAVPPWIVRLAVLARLFWAVPILAWMYASAYATGPSWEAALLGAALIWSVPALGASPKVSRVWALIWLAASTVTGFAFGVWALRAMTPADAYEQVARLYGFRTVGLGEGLLLAAFIAFISWMAARANGRALWTRRFAAASLLAILTVATSPMGMVSVLPHRTDTGAVTSVFAVGVVIVFALLEWLLSGDGTRPTPLIGERLDLGSATLEREAQRLPGGGEVA